MTQTVLPALALAAFALLLPANPAQAAESYDNCAGTIGSLPTVITTQGVWCLKQDLASASASGAAITVSAHNVTIDCNGFKLGGLGAGLGTVAVGIEASGRSNLTVRGCSIRGFATGLRIEFGSAGGHLVEDNRFDGNTVYGIYLGGDGSMIRRNQVLDTGASTDPYVSRVAGIYAIGNVDVLDNTVRGADGSASISAYAYGIAVAGANASEVARNRVSGVTAHPAGEAFGIRPLSSSGVTVRDNSLVGVGNGIACAGAGNFVLGNTLYGFTTALSGCVDGGGNIF